MSEEKYSDDKLNLFIDEQLELAEIDEIHQAVLADAALSTRVCQLKAVRELVKYAYECTPVQDETIHKDKKYKNMFWQGIAASFLLMIGVSVGWVGNGYLKMSHVVSASEVFDYFKFKSVIDRTERRIVIHVTTSDVLAIKNTLDEVEQLLTSYSDAKSPMQLDIVTFRDGINMLRVDGSPYIGRIQSLLDSNENVAIYACKRSIDKAKKKWGHDVVLMPETVTTKTAKELISDRLNKGWVYIKV